MRPLTCSFFLLLPLGRLFLLAVPYLFGTCLSSQWSLPFPLHAPALISPSLAKVRLSFTLTLHHLTIWCFGQTALLLFLLAIAALAYLLTALYVALRPLFPFQQVQYAQVFPLKPGPFYKLFAGLSNTSKNDASDELARWEQFPCSFSPLISRIRLSLFSDRRRTVSSKFFDTQVPSVSTEELALPRHARCVLSRLRFNGHGLLLRSYLSRNWRIENPSCTVKCLRTLVSEHLSSHSALSSFGLFSPLTLWRLSVSLYDLWSRPWELPGSGAPWSSAMPPFIGRGRETAT